MTARLQAFVNQWNGKGLDFDGVYGFQCKDLANAWARLLGHDLPAGNAIDMAGRAVPGYTWIPNSANNAPQSEDIVVWGKVIGPYGHIAVATGDNTNQSGFDSFDQNWPVGAVCNVRHHNYIGVLGWLRPDAPVAPAPIPAATSMEKVTVTVQTLRVHRSPNTSDAGTFANRKFNPDGMLHGSFPGHLTADVVSIKAVVKGQDVYGDGYDDWIQTPNDNYIHAKETSFYDAHPDRRPAAPTPPAPAPTPAPTPTPIPVEVKIDPVPLAPDIKPEETVLVKDFKDELGKPRKVWVQAKANVSIYDIPTGAIEPNVYIPAGLIFPVTRMKVLAGNSYYQTDKMRSFSPNNGIKVIDVREVENPELAAADKLAELGVWDRMIAPVLHALNRQGYFKWLFVKKQKVR